MIFKNENDFENALITLLFDKGWEKNVLKYKTEEELIQNWADILFENNRGIERLNDFPLTKTEMGQILDQIAVLRTPLKLNGFINGKTITIKRDNLDDTLHYGKEISLKIYDRHEIAAGQSRYQIAQQPQLKTTHPLASDRRGDLMLLINGMPLFHIELKRSGVPVSQAYNQIEKYARQGVYTGIFSLIQIFVAMEPEETVYFANPGPDGKFNKDYYFNWADVNNVPINNWMNIGATLLSIPMAHELIGFYTIADDTDGILKVMRSYQYYAASKIADVVSQYKWATNKQKGGYIWHTTGSGKTMTSFKAAQLISNTNDADKVVFLVDRIELATQSLIHYKGFADDTESIQATENTDILMSKLESEHYTDKLIVTSIQKMSNIKEDSKYSQQELDRIINKRIVFIVDEAHRSTFGDMMYDIKNTFTKALFFGFTGTPIIEKNQKNMSGTDDVFGEELHRYSITDGITDKNVLGFDPYQVLTYRDKDLRKAVALERAKAQTELEALTNSNKKTIYLHYMHTASMAGYVDNNGDYVKGIEDYIPSSQYATPEHQEKVVENILENWMALSQNGQFHAIFATSSINEAITYYRLIKSKNTTIKVTALFDPSIDNNGEGAYKEDGLIEIIEDYNKMFEQKFTVSSYAQMKKDISLRLSHKAPYLGISNTPEKQIDILIVVDQMLTGFDSKWVNTLYLDKLLRMERIIQAFSRTNRLFGPEKPFGTILYYRKPHTMKRNIEEAFEEYSGNRKFGMFVDKLEQNLKNMNRYFQEIKYLFESNGVNNFEQLPKEKEARAKFAKLFNIFNIYLEAARIQGFHWSTLKYKIKNDGKTSKIIELELDENVYLALLQRYKELTSIRGGSTSDDLPYDIETYITEISTETIDADYMNSRFEKYLKSLDAGDTQIVEKTLNDLHRTFATLSQEDQKCAGIFLRDIQRGDVVVEKDKTLKDYINEYKSRAKEDQIHKFSQKIGVDENALREFMKTSVSDKNINEYGRFDNLIKTVDKNTAKRYFENRDNTPIPLFKVNILTNDLIRDFILNGGFDLE
ncbi:MAG: type I restriction endonuclease subunit R [Christensenellales bacterium]